jgi:hypothetical protein
MSTRTKDQGPEPARDGRRFAEGCFHVSNIGQTLRCGSASIPLVPAPRLEPGDSKRVIPVQEGVCL